MDYGEWIERERRIRVKILFSSPDITEKGIFRACAACDEICLCHEAKCPNCNSSDIGTVTLDFGGDDKALRERIRCNYRYAGINKE